MWRCPAPVPPINGTVTATALALHQYSVSEPPPPQAGVTDQHLLPMPQSGAFDRKPNMESTGKEVAFN